ncbi:MAG TPA: hypothetical protein VHN36_15345 [Ilumatobacteraceae bacterium]|nr:hypothetical protein [Ilumatobacteraceae bacterium]
MAHHLRSGLNNVVYEAAELAAGRHLTEHEARSIEFPIVSHAGDFEVAARRGLQHAYDLLVDHVRAFQPYGNGDGFLQPGAGLLNQHPLELLRLFNNYDKHRVRWTVAPIPVVVQLDDDNGYTTITFTTDPPDPMPELEPSSAPIESGTVLLRQRCGVPLKSVSLRGGVGLAPAILTPAGPIDAVVLGQSWILVGGLVILRIDDLTVSIDEVYRRLQIAMTPT